MIRPGRAVLAWYGREGGRTRGLLAASVHGRSVAFVDGLGAARTETVAGERPLSLYCSEVVERVLRPELTDPALLLSAHAARMAQREASATDDGSADAAALIEEIRSSYERVLERERGRGRRKARNGRSVPTLAGRAASTLSRLRAHLGRIAREFNRN